MNISCKVIQDLLPLYHDGVTSLETNALVEEHLQTCEACQEEFHKLQEAVDLAQAPGGGGSGPSLPRKGGTKDGEPQKSKTIASI